MNTFFNTLLERREEVLKLFIEHMEMTSTAVLVSLIIGVVIGIEITKNKTAASIVIGVANLMQSIPSIGLLAFMVPLVGIGQKPAIIMIVIYALLPIIKNTYTGITGIDPKLLEAARGIGLSKWRRLLQVKLPLALPFIMAGIRISAVTAVGTVTIAAFAGAGGLGWMINLGLNANDSNLVLLGAIPACLLALLLDLLLGKVEKSITPEGLKPADQIVYISHNKRMMHRGFALALCAILLIVPTVSSLTKKFLDSDERIVIGAQNFTESLIMGDIYSELIKAKTDIPVEKTFNLSGTMITVAALKSGDIDMFTDYTGVLTANVLKLPMETDPQKVYNSVKKGLKEQLNFETSAPIGSSNTYVMAVTPDISKKYNLTKLSQLIAQAPNLRCGCTTWFLQREDLLPKMQKEFNIHFKDVVGLEGNIRYQAILSGEVEVTDAYETDAIVKKSNLVRLKDDIDFFPPYQVVNIFGADLLKKYPELKEVLALLDGAITTDEITELNYQVDVEGLTTQEVAHNFLISKNII